MLSKTETWPVDLERNNARMVRCMCNGKLENSVSAVKHGNRVLLNSMRE